ncbi:MFS transporter [Rhodococcus erythropolis]
MVDSVTTEGSKVPEAAARRRAIYAGFIGNFIEWYDFALYGYFAVTISALFFSNSDPTVALLSTFAVFAVGFVARPIGAYVFGRIGDRYGRRRALVISVLMMSTATVLLGALPTYNTIGVWATALLVVLRLFQGFSGGGEYAGATIYVIEHAPKGWRGRYGSLSPVAAGVGPAVAAIISLTITGLVSTDALHSWGWRIPFLLSLPLGIVAIVMRMRIEESPEFVAVRESNQIEDAPLREALRVARPQMATVFGWNIINGVGFYVFTGFSVAYMLKVAKLDYTAALGAVSIALLIHAAACPIMGYFLDKVGRRPVAVTATLGYAVFGPIAFYLFHKQQFASSLIALVGIGICAAGVSCVTAVSMVDLFPARFRYSAGAIPYQFSVAIFGGTAPYVATWLGGSSFELAPGFYLSSIALIACVVGWFGFRGIPTETSATRATESVHNVSAARTTISKSSTPEGTSHHG